MNPDRSENLHRCAIPNCESVILKDRLMCLRHWKKVPDQLQSAVYDAWGAFKRAKEAAEPTKELIGKYFEIRRQAIHAVLEREA